MARHKTDFVDDGRTVADMADVRSSSGLLTGSGPVGTTERESRRDFSEELQDSEARLMVLMGTLKAALSLGMVYIVGFGIAIALMVWLWK